MSSSLCSMILVVGLLYIAFSMLKYAHASLDYPRLSYHEGMLDFVIFLQ